MAISLKASKQIWGAAASRCSFPTCRRELVVEATPTDDESLVGDLCHIVARSPDGPRGQSCMTFEERDRAENLILLCKIHHKCIDDQFLYYTAPRVLEIKRQHESWVRTALSEACGNYSAFALFELSYNAFWALEHSEHAARMRGKTSDAYGVHIYQRINRCQKSLESLGVELPEVQLAINDVYEIFSVEDINYSHVQSFSYSLAMKIRNSFLAGADKKVISISRSLVSLLKAITLHEKVDIDAFALSVELFLGREDPVINNILRSGVYAEFEGRLYNRLEEIL